MVEGGSNTAQRFVTRLHSVIRPFVLRRLKTEVAKQMPKKYEHIVQLYPASRQKPYEALTKKKLLLNALNRNSFFRANFIHSEGLLTGGGG